MSLNVINGNTGENTGRSVFKTESRCVKSVVGVCAIRLG